MRTDESRSRACAAQAATTARSSEILRRRLGQSRLWPGIRRPASPVFACLPAPLPTMLLSLMSPYILRFACRGHACLSGLLAHSGCAVSAGLAGGLDAVRIETGMARLPICRNLAHGAAWPGGGLRGAARAGTYGG